MNTKNRIIEHLQAFGVKPSVQRIAIMNYMMNHYVHPTVDTVYNGLISEMPTLSKTTVYNTLKLLAQHGAVQELYIDEKNVRFDGDLSQHAHFRCKKCGQVYDLPMGNMDIANIKTKTGFVITDCQLYYRGFCSKCKK
ncbi:transcriptional repressor [Bacteroidia bacterium]|nr:transcriptional repressor [Bacteroidia bacterium]